MLVFCKSLLPMVCVRIVWKDWRQICSTSVLSLVTQACWFSAYSQGKIENKRGRITFKKILLKKQLHLYKCCLDKRGLKKQHIRAYGQGMAVPSISELSDVLSFGETEASCYRSSLCSYSFKLQSNYDILHKVIDVSKTFLRNMNMNVTKLNITSKHFRYEFLK